MIAVFADHDDAIATSPGLLDWHICEVLRHRTLCPVTQKPPSPLLLTPICCSPALQLPGAEGRGATPCVGTGNRRRTADSDSTHQRRGDGADQCGKQSLLPIPLAKVHGGLRISNTMRPCSQLPFCMAFEARQTGLEDGWGRSPNLVANSSITPVVYMICPTGQHAHNWDWRLETSGRFRREEPGIRLCSVRLEGDGCAEARPASSADLEIQVGAAWAVSQTIRCML